MYISSASLVRKADQLTIQNHGIPAAELMDRAGKGAANILMERFPDKATSFLVLAGKGNNGGDGLVVAFYLRKSGYEVAVNADLKTWSVKNGVIIDALFGTGLSREIEGQQSQLIQDVNRSKYFVASLDIPSGFDAENGKPQKNCIRADLTITFGAVKWGLLTEAAHEWIGDLESVDIGYPQSVCDELKFQDCWVDRSFLQGWMKSRARASHKGSHGHLLALGGSEKKPGAIMLSGYAALRTGTGLVTIGLPNRAFRKFPKDFLELMFEPLSSNKNGEFGKVTKRNILKILERKTALAIGPGMGTSKDSHALLKVIIQTSQLPLVIDADALNILAEDPKLIKILAGKKAILTPHPGEMGRLTNISVKKLTENRVDVARDFAMKNKVYLLLKGHRTIMATPEGKIFVNSTGNAAMAIAGMGDTLTGIIGAFLAQGYEPKKAMILACWIHGAAGDLVAKRLGDRGMIARDVADAVPLVMKGLL